MAGIYYELRTLRRMLEVVMQAQGYDLPAKSTREDVEELQIDPPSEEQLAAAAARQIQIDRLEGRDPGTTWMEDPNR